MYHIAGKFGRGMFGELTLLSIWRKKVWRINRSANKLLIVSIGTNLDGFSLANRGQFVKFAKLSPPDKLSHFMVAHFCQLQNISH